MEFAKLRRWPAAIVAVAAAAFILAPNLGGCGSNGLPGSGGIGLGIYTPGGGNHTVVAGAAVEVDPGTLDFGSDHSDLSFDLHNPGESSLEIQFVNAPDWAVADQTQAQLDAGQTLTVAVHVDRTGRSPATYSGALRINVPGANPAFVVLRMTVGAGGASNPNTPSGTGRLRVTPTDLNFGATTRTRSILVRCVGGALDYAATTGDSWISLVNPTGASDNTYETVRINVDRANLPAGTYDGTVTVSAGGEQVSVAVHLTVTGSTTGGGSGGPTLYVSRGELNYGSQQRSLTLLVRNTGGGTLNFTVQSQVAWAQPNVTGGASNGNYRSIAVVVDRSGLAPADYVGSLFVIADNGQSQEVVIRMTVAASPNQPALAVSTNVIDFGEAISVTSFTLHNAGGGSFTYTLSPDQSWVALSPTIGSNSGEVDLIRVTIDRAALPAGNYIAVINIVTDFGFALDVEVLAKVSGVDGGGNAGPPPWPNSDERMDGLSVLQQYVVAGFGTPFGYPLERWAAAPVALITQVNLDPGQPPYPYMWAQLLAALHTANPDAVALSYISGGDCRKAEDMVCYPPEYVEYRQMPPEWFVTPYDDAQHLCQVDMTRADARELFADLIVAEVLNRGAPGLFMDNYRHPYNGGTLATWPQMCSFLYSVTNRLMEHNIRTSVNLSTPYLWPDEDVALLAESGQGASFEQPFDFRHVRPIAGQVVREIEVYRYWLDHGMLLSLWAAELEILHDQPLRDAEGRVLAGMCMIIRRPGDALFVPRQFWRELPDWVEWPLLFGPALGDYEFVSTSPVVLRRRFQNVTITVDLGASLDHARSFEAVTLQWN